MPTATALTIFLFAMLFLGASSWRQWSLNPAQPLDVDEELPLPWVGYGSSALSLSGLFGAYTSAYLFAGTAALLGVLIGVLAAILIVQNRLRDGPQNFQRFIQTLRISTAPALDILFVLALVIALWGLCVSEAVILEAALRESLHLPSATALASALAIALVCYYYCLLAGYQAVFRTDVLQYCALLAMAIGLLLFGPDVIPDKPTATTPTSSLLLIHGKAPLAVRALFDVLVGTALGMIPVLGSPDAWKRVVAVNLRSRFRYSGLYLLFPAALPLLALYPVFLRISHGTSRELLPVDLLFSGAGTGVTILLVCGMTAAFMSTFDSALVGSSHLLLVRQEVAGLALGRPSLQRYRLILALTFLIVIVASVVCIRVAPHPYFVALFFVGPAAILVGLIAGTRLFLRQLARAWVGSAVLIALAAWVAAYLWNMESVDIRANAEGGLGITSLAISFFYIFAVLGYIGSDVVSEGQQAS